MNAALGVLEWTMKSWMASIGLVVLLTGSVSPAISAGAAEPGDIGIFADMEGTISSIQIGMHEMKSLYVVAFPPAEGMRAFEVGIDLSPELVSTWTVIQPSPSQTPLGDNSWIISLGICTPALQPVALVELELLALQRVLDGTVCVKRLTESPITSLGDGIPGYFTCRSELRPFTPAQNGQGHYPDGCLVVNPTMSAPVSVESVDFGAWKARY